MRLAAVILAGITVTSAAWAADGILGDWKLNPAKSVSSDGRVPKDGRALIEPDNTGGYLQITETAFADGPAVRFNSRVQFDGTQGNGMFEDRPVRFVSRRIDANGFEVSVSNPDTGQVERMIRASFEPRDHTLTVSWADGKSAPTETGI